MSKENNGFKDEGKTDRVRKRNREGRQAHEREKEGGERAS